MKTEEGFVIEIAGSIAQVKVGRHSECKNCGACPGDNSVIVSAKNDIGAVVGQRVLFEVKETNAVMAAFLVFIVPLIGLFLGAVLGWFVSTYMHTNTTIFEIAGAAIVFILILIGIKLFDKSIAKDEKSKPVIIKIL